MIVFLVIFFDIMVMKRIEIVKNCIKIELEISMQIVDVKQQKFAIFFDTKHKELQQALVKQKRFSDTWVSFDRRENDFLNKEIRTLRALDKIDFFVGANESKFVGFEKVSINNYPKLFGFDFFQFLKKFDFSSTPISVFVIFQI